MFWVNIYFFNKALKLALIFQSIFVMEFLFKFFCHIYKPLQIGGTVLSCNDQDPVDIIAL